jgi:hypothetical protein
MHWECPRCGFTLPYVRKCDECHKVILAGDDFFRAEEGDLVLCYDCFWGGVLFDDRPVGKYSESGSIKVIHGWKNKVRCMLDSCLELISGKGSR